MTDLTCFGKSFCDYELRHIDLILEQVCNSLLNVTRAISWGRVPLTLQLPSRRDR